MLIDFLVLKSFLIILVLFFLGLGLGKFRLIGWIVSGIILSMFPGIIVIPMNYISALIFVALAVYGFDSFSRFRSFHHGSHLDFMLFATQSIVFTLVAYWISDVNNFLVPFFVGMALAFPLGFMGMSMGLSFGVGAISAFVSTSVVPIFIGIFTGLVLGLLVWRFVPHKGIFLFISILLVSLFAEIMGGVGFFAAASFGFFFGRVSVRNRKELSEFNLKLSYPLQAIIGIFAGYIIGFSFESFVIGFFLLCVSFFVRFIQRSGFIPPFSGIKINPFENKNFIYIQNTGFFTFIRKHSFVRGEVSLVVLLLIALNMPYYPILQAALVVVMGSQVFK